MNIGKESIIKIILIDWKLEGRRWYIWELNHKLFNPISNVSCALVLWLVGSQKIKDSILMTASLLHIWLFISGSVKADYKGSSFLILLVLPSQWSFRMITHSFSAGSVLLTVSLSHIWRFISGSVKADYKGNNLLFLLSCRSIDWGCIILCLHLCREVSPLPQRVSLIRH